MSKIVKVIGSNVDGERMPDVIVEVSDESKSVCDQALNVVRKRISPRYCGTQVVDSGEVFISV